MESHYVIRMVVAFVFASLITACDGSYASEGKSTTRSAFGQDEGACPRELSALDYSDLIADLDHLSPYDEGAGYSFGAPHQLLVDDLSQAEERLVGVIVIDSEQQSSLFETVMRVSSYISAHGRTPKDGAELFDSMRKAGASLDEFLAMSQINQYKIVCSAINPITGHFYESFDSPEWSPGGLVIVPETDPGYLNSHWTSYVGDDGGLPEIWHVIVFGESQGRVLLDKHVAVNAQPRDYSMPRMTESTTKLFDR